MMTGKNEITDDDLEAYIDGLLDPAREAEIASKLTADPKMGELVQAMRFQNDALRHLGEEVLDEPIPERLRAVVDQLNEVEPKPRRKGFLLAATRRRLAGLAVLSAASLLLGF